jgi:hypothetical protein
MRRGVLHGLRLVGTRYKSYKHRLRFRLRLLLLLIDMADSLLSMQFAIAHNK